MRSHVAAGVGIRPLHALSITDLPLYHQDPFDRMLITQARMERMVFTFQVAVNER